MSKAITQADADEIMEFCETHPNCRIIQDEVGWSVRILNGNYYSEIHPLTFLDVIRGADSEDVLKVK